MEDAKQIWTIGHSTRALEDFLDILRSFGIQMLVDIRTFPGSRRFPHFNKENLSASLKLAGINYVHEVNLGGRRKPEPNSVNTAWRHNSFRGYADYMKTTQFISAIEDLQRRASVQRVVYMCSEAVWWKCHRALVSDFLKVKGWKVNHIMDKYKSTEHPFTSPAKSIQGELFY